MDFEAQYADNIEFICHNIVRVLVTFVRVLDRSD